MMGMFIKKNVEPMIAIYLSSAGLEIWKHHWQLLFYFWKFNLTQQNKKSVRKAAYFYAKKIVKYGKKSIMNMDGQINGKKTYG